MKSLSDCLKFIDAMILCDIEKHTIVECLEDIRYYMLTLYNDKYIEDMVNMRAAFSQINLIIDNFYLDNESNIKKQYYTLRKRILAWLQERNTETEVDNDE